MNRVNLNSLTVALLGMSLVMCLPAGVAEAQEQIVWPVVPDLMYHDGDIAELWHDVGDVAMWNTKEDLFVDLRLGEDMKIEEVSIHVVRELDEFEALFDKKGELKVKNFDYRTDYLGEYGFLAKGHLEPISVGESIRTGALPISTSSCSRNCRSSRG